MFRAIRRFPCFVLVFLIAVAPLVVGFAGLQFFLLNDPYGDKDCVHLAAQTADWRVRWGRWFRLAAVGKIGEQCQYFTRARLLTASHCGFNSAQAPCQAHSPPLCSFGHPATQVGFTIETSSHSIVKAYSWDCGNRLSPAEVYSGKV
jgi:hypothetical protein